MPPSPLASPLRSAAVALALALPLANACGGATGNGGATDDTSTVTTTGSGGATTTSTTTTTTDALFDAGGGGDDAAPGDAGKPLVNLVPNGDFSAGNVGFSSDYAYAPKNQVEGEYTVGADPQAFNGSLLSVGDHTTGSGLMFIGNGKATPDRVWVAGPIAVQPNTLYYFEAWVMNACCPPPLGDGVNPVGPSQLTFFANDQALGTRTSQKLGVWEGLGTTWASGAATSVTLKLVNANTEAMGNDFGVDDVFLGTQSSIPPPE